MRALDYVQEYINQNKIPKVSLWYGEERFLLEEALQALKSAFLKEDASGSSIETFAAREAPPEIIVEAANTFSFFRNRLVIVQDVTYFQDGAGNLEPFYTYIENPNPVTCLVFISESVHKGKKLFKLLEKTGSILEFAAPKRPQDWLAWVRSELQVRGKEMSGETITALLDWAGHQAGVLSQELDKLAVYTGQRKVITKEDIQKVVTRSSEATVFNLLDAIAQRSADQAIKKLHEVLLVEHPLKVMTLLTRQVRLLLGARFWREQGKDSAGLSDALGIKPYEAQKIWAQSAQMSFPVLDGALTECLNTEIALKNGGGEPAFLLEMMIIRFCKAR